MDMHTDKLYTLVQKIDGKGQPLRDRRMSKAESSTFWY